MAVSFFLLVVVTIVCVLAGVVTIWVVGRLPHGPDSTHDDPRRR